MDFKLFDKKSSDGAVKGNIMSNQELSNTNQLSGHLKNGKYTHLL